MKELLFYTILSFLLSLIRSDTTINQLLTSSQFIFVPNSSYYQFRVSLSLIAQDKQQEIEQGNFLAEIKQINTTIKLQILNLTSSTLFNLIVIPVNAQNTSFAFYSCYIRAAFEGLSNANCPITNLGEGINGDCTYCVLNGLTTNQPYACLMCNQSVQISILSYDQQNDFGPIEQVDKSILFIVDNTNVISKTGVYLQLQMGYLSNLQISKDYDEILAIFFILLVVLIVVILAAAIRLTLKIRSTQNLIKNLTKNQ